MDYEDEWKKLPDSEKCQRCECSRAEQEKARADHVADTSPAAFEAMLREVLADHTMFGKWERAAVMRAIKKSRRIARELA